MTARGTRLDPFWHVDHPVLHVLRERGRSGSEPGHRDDPYVIGLAIEGGGMRGVVSAAMLNALEDLGFAGAFDRVYGGSSGSLNAAYFLAGDLWRNLSIYYDDLASKDFVDLRRLLRRRPVLDVDFAFDHVLELTRPLDYDAVLNSPTRLHVPVTLVDELSTIWPSDFTSRDDLKDALRAGAWLPLLTHGNATFRGHPAMDGLLLIAHPATHARRDGCTHVLSLSTRPVAPPQPNPSPFQRYVGNRLELRRPGLGRGYVRSIREYAVERALFNRQRVQPTGPPYVLDLCPAAGARTVRRHESDPGKLSAVARAAYETMVWALSGHRQEAFARLTTVEQEARRTWGRA